MTPAGIRDVPLGPDDDGLFGADVPVRSGVLHVPHVVLPDVETATAISCAWAPAGAALPRGGAIRVPTGGSVQSGANARRNDADTADPGFVDVINDGPVAEPSSGRRA